MDDEWDWEELGLGSTKAEAGALAVTFVALTATAGVCARHRLRAHRAQRGEMWWDDIMLLVAWVLNLVVTIMYLASVTVELGSLVDKTSSLGTSAILFPRMGSVQLSFASWLVCRFSGLLTHSWLFPELEWLFWFCLVNMLAVNPTNEMMGWVGCYDPDLAEQDGWGVKFNRITDLARMLVIDLIFWKTSLMPIKTKRWPVISVLILCTTASTAIMKLFHPNLSCDWPTWAMYLSCNTATAAAIVAISLPALPGFQSSTTTSQYRHVPTSEQESDKKHDFTIEWLASQSRKGLGRDAGSAREEPAMSELGG